MRVYKHGLKENRGVHTVFVQPGTEYPEVTDWHNEEGHAILLPVVFTDGVADVPSNLGQYLIDKGLASSSPIKKIKAN